MTWQSSDSHRKVKWMDTGSVGVWTFCESRSDLESRLRATPDRVLGPVATEDASSWGYLTLGDWFLPIGFVDLGIKPKAVTAEGVTAVGFDDLVVGFETPRWTALFR